MAPSRTAQGAARHRAAHQLFDDPLVFEDPLALAVLGAEDERALRATDPEEGRRGAPGRAFVVARSRFAEDRVAAAVARGVGQAVVLGAGLDTFACRNPHPGLRVFELDEDSTQRWKRTRLEEVGIAVPGDVVFAPIDLRREALPAVLARASFDRRRPAVVTWLGVVLYLPPTTVLSTLAALASALAPGSEVVFDYAVPPSRMETVRRHTFRAMGRGAAAQGEPYRSAFEPESLAPRVKHLGFSTVADEGPESLDARYFLGRADGLSLRGPGHVLTAGV